MKRYEHRKLALVRNILAIAVFLLALLALLGLSAPWIFVPDAWVYHKLKTDPDWGMSFIAKDGNVLRMKPYVALVPLSENNTVFYFTSSNGICEKHKVFSKDICGRLRLYKHERAFERCRTPYDILYLWIDCSIRCPSDLECKW